MAHDLALLAERQLRDYDGRTPGSIFGDPEFSLTIPEAYELQFQVAKLRESRGESIAGYKIGCLSEPIRKQLGMKEPLIGHIYATELHQSNVSLNVNAFHQLAIEGEFAFRIAEDVPDAVWLAANLGRAVESAFAVIELHNPMCRAAASMRAQELIANNGIHAGVVLAAQGTRLSDAGELLTERISVIKNGVELGDRTARLCQAARRRVC